MFRSVIMICSRILLIFVLILSTSCLSEIKVDIVKGFKKVFTPNTTNSLGRNAFSESFPIGNKLTFLDRNLRGLTVDGSGSLYLTDTDKNQVYKISNEGKTVFSLGINSPGIADGEFSNPYAAIMDSSEKFYIVDKDNNRVQKFNSDGSHLFSAGSYGKPSSVSLFSTSSGIFVDSDNNYYFSERTVSNKLFKFSSTGESLMSIGGGVGNYDFPGGVAGVVVDSQKNIYVVDFGNTRIQAYDKDGVWLRTVASSAAGPGQLVDPVGLAIDSSDNIYVSDYNSNKILKFSSTGTHLLSFGTSGNGIGELSGPIGMTIDAAGNIFVCDSINSRIQKFDSSGNSILTFGSVGVGAGLLAGPKDVALDSLGNIYVAERDNYRVQKFSPAGVHISYMANDGNFMPVGIVLDSADNLILADTYMNLARINPSNVITLTIDKYVVTKELGKFDSPSDIAVDENGSFYVADLGNQRIQKFDSSGNFIFALGSYGVLNGQFSNPKTLAVDKNGNIYVADDRERIQKFDSAGNFILSFGSQGSGSSLFNNISDIIIDDGNNIYVSDRINSYVQKFDSNGNYLFTFGVSGSGQLQQPLQMAIDNNGFIIVTDVDKGIVTFKSDGTYVMSWRSRGDNDGELKDAIGATFDSFGNIYISDTGNNRIQKFSSLGVHLLTIPAGVMVGPIRVDSSGNIWAIDYTNTTVLKFNSSGTLLLNVGAYGNGDGQFENLQDIELDSFGNLYVVDSNLYRVQKFDSAGNFLMKFGSSGSINGRFNNPTGLAIDDNDNLYVADTGNARIQKFQLNGAYVSQFAMPLLSGGQNFMASDSAGNLYVTNGDNGTIEKVSSTGVSLLTITGASGDGTLGKFFGINGIALDPNENIYIVDGDNNRVQRFNSLGSVFD